MGSYPHVSLIPLKGYQVNEMKMQMQKCGIPMRFTEIKFFSIFTLEKEIVAIISNLPRFIYSLQDCNTLLKCISCKTVFFVSRF